MEIRESLFGNKDISWMDDAACSETADPEIFFPPRDKDTYKEISNLAKAMCFGENKVNPCPVRKQCLLYAIEMDEQHGIWGGLSHRERNALVRKWQKSFKNTMTLKEFILKIDKKGKINVGTK